MAALRRNEASLINTQHLVDTPARVGEAAIAVFDICIPNKGKVDVALETSLMQAYDHWKEILTHTFPSLLGVGWSHIYDALAAVNVGYFAPDQWRNRPENLTAWDRQQGIGQNHFMRDILTRNGRNK